MIKITKNQYTTTEVIVKTQTKGTIASCFFKAIFVITIATIKRCHLF